MTWDTANDVGALFGLASTVQEIDALEVVIPAPGTFGIGAAALLALAPARHRRRGAMGQERALSNERGVCW